MKSETKCPHPKCSQMKPRHHYACFYHWKGLPPIIQKKIMVGYKMSAREWLAANEMALKHWNEQETKPEVRT